MLFLLDLETELWVFKQRTEKGPEPEKISCEEGMRVDSRWMFGRQREAIKQKRVTSAVFALPIPSPGSP